MGLTFEPLLIGSSRDYQIQILNPDDCVPTGQFLSTDDPDTTQLPSDVTAIDITT